MRVLNNASFLFFNRGYSLSDVSVFNGIDAATGAPSMPATGSPGSQTPGQAAGGALSSLEKLKIRVEEAQRKISTLGQQNSDAADQQQSALESAISDADNAIGSLIMGIQAQIMANKQAGVIEKPAGSEQDAGSAAGAGGMPATDMGMGSGTDLGLGGDVGLGGMPPAEGQAAPVAPTPPAPMPAAEEAPLPAAGASAPGMTTYDDLTQLNKTGVTGQGGSTMPIQ